MSEKNLADSICVRNERSRARFAAGVLGASLTLSTLAFAQGTPALTGRNNDRLSAAKTPENRPVAAAKSQLVSGTVTDIHGAAIPNAQVTLTGVSNGARLRTQCNEEGEYGFSNVDPGSYRLEVAAAAFKERSIDIDVREDSSSSANIELEVPEVFVTMGIVAYAEYSGPLFRAVSDNNSDLVKQLIGTGENVNSKDDGYGEITPLFLAVENGNAGIVEILLEFGANVNARDDAGQTPLMRIDDDADVEVVRTLIKYGAKVDLTDRQGNNALILAARNADPEVLKILILETDDIDARNSRGRTALVEAADEDNVESVKALLIAGANVNLKDKEGETAWDLTTNPQIERLLERYGAIVN